MEYAWALEENFDFVAALAFWAGAAVAAITVLLMIFIVVLRLLSIYRERRRGRLVEKWRPVFMASLVEEPRGAPVVKKRDTLVFLELFNSYHGFIKGESKEGLNRLAGLAGMPERALAFLKSADMEKRIIAAMTLGRLREERAWGRLAEMIGAAEPALSLHAARAMVFINTEWAMPHIVDQFAKRDDWPVSSIANILKEAGEGAVSLPLAKAIDSAIEKDRRTARKLAPLLDLVYYEYAGPIARKALARAADTETVAACLKVMNDPADLELVRSYLKHPEWYVRVQAVAALGRTGLKEDRKRLVESLSDGEWWVRYRAARALVEMPFYGKAGLAALRGKIRDRFARDILAQVIAEMDMT